MRRAGVGVGAVALATMAVGCASIVGIDKEYELLGGGGAAAANGSGGVPTTVASSGVGPSSATGSSGGGSGSTASSGGGTVPPLPNCAESTPICGEQGNEDCCASPLVPGGTFNRNNNSNYPATVNDFRLDRFEVTVGRFRAFVAAYPGSKPKEGDGAHPKIPGTGWNPAWDTHMPVDKEALTTLMMSCIFKYPARPTWTNEPGENEDLPMSCISWHEAFAFCAWDGGRLPTEAEWNYAAAGGAEQRKYPWGSTAPNSTLAVYDCMGDGSTPGDCEFTDILKGGSRPNGAAKWGQMDMAGSMWEFTLDWFGSPFEVPCVDCANQKVGSSHVAFGGSWIHEANELITTFRGDIPEINDDFLDMRTYRDDRDGVRCARAM